MSRSTQYRPYLTLSQAFEATRPQSCIDTSSNTIDSETSWQVALHWIDDCCKNHEKCGVKRHAIDLETAWLPSRLIELETSGGTKSKVVYLRDGFCKDNLVQYATLSHCWGPELTFLKLTLATLTTFKNGVEIEKLSRTFQDSITLTRRLGLRYIWIDALCIVQDSKQDWIREAALMAKVYSRSQINLAATASLDSNGGFLRTRNPLTIMPLKVELDCEGLVKGTYFCFLQDPWLRYMKWAPLMRRAWIFQERLLAPRTLHFGPEQLLWECNELQASETHPKGSLFTSQKYHPGMLNGKLKWEFATRCQIKNTSMDNAAIPSAWITKPTEAGFEFARAWEAIVEQYTNLLLTKESDRLIAIAGVASLLKESIPRQRYLAGIWENHLGYALLWHTVGPGRRPQHYQAPSWSWASIVGHLWLGDPRGERFEDSSSTYWKLRQHQSIPSLVRSRMDTFAFVQDCAEPDCCTMTWRSIAKATSLVSVQPRSTMITILSGSTKREASITHHLARKCSAFKSRSQILVSSWVPTWTRRKALVMQHKVFFWNPQAVAKVSTIGLANSIFEGFTRATL